MNHDKLIPHLFRTEYSKLVAVLSRKFGLDHIELAEDIASATFLKASESWPYTGVPENPVGWLYITAKNLTLNKLRRNSLYQTKIQPGLVAMARDADDIVIDFSETNIRDSMLQMLFAVCHPSISVESQIALALRILCGFGLEEIANAFLTNKEVIHKRLQRAKARLRSEGIEIKTPGEDEIDLRLESVLRTLYLLFSEGYYSESNSQIIRKELCVEAMNLNYLLLENVSTNTHGTNALMALMCFQASRIEARTAGSRLILYDEQDRDLWDSALIEKGFYYLQQASKWDVVSKYYIESSIAYWHTVDEGNQDKWPGILNLYNALTEIDASPVVRLNRVYAVSKVMGDPAALDELNSGSIPENVTYFILAAHLNRNIDPRLSKQYLQQALSLSRNDAERHLIKSKLDCL